MLNDGPLKYPMIGSTLFVETGEGRLPAPGSILGAEWSTHAEHEAEASRVEVLL